MRELMKFIEQLVAKNEFEVLSSNLLQGMQHQVDEFVIQTYPLIPHGKYVTLDFNEHHDGIAVHLAENFETLLQQHYPEKMI